MGYIFQFGEVIRYWEWLVQGVAVTLGYSILGLVLTVTLGTLGALARRSRHPGLRLAGRLYVEGVRNTPFLVQLFVLFFGLPSAGIRFDPYTAALIGLA